MLNKITKYFKHPGLLLVKLDNCGAIRLRDKVYLNIIYKYVFGKKINWDAPKTYNEKLQWLKINDRRDAYATIVDKVAVRSYVAKIIGDKYLVPLIGTYDSFDEIDFDKLPERFVIKCNHDSGGVVICKDKATFDIDLARRKINASLRKNFFFVSREWPYKSVKPCIMIERYLEDKRDGELRDYKFFCFDGEPRLMFVATDRQANNKETCFDFFDLKYNHLKIKNGHPNAKIPPRKPDHFEKMIELSKKLSAGFPHIRVDFYEVNNKIYFGELTLYHFGGMTKFEPEEWDKKIGDLLVLPEKTDGK